MEICKNAKTRCTNLLALCHLLVSYLLNSDTFLSWTRFVLSSFVALFSILLFIQYTKCDFNTHKKLYAGYLDSIFSFYSLKKLKKKKVKVIRKMPKKKIRKILLVIMIIKQCLYLMRRKLPCSLSILYNNFFLN